MPFPTTKSIVLDGPPGVGTEIEAHFINNLEDKVGIDGDTNPNSLDYKVNQRIISNPKSGEYRILNIRLDASLKIVITYDDTPIP